MQGGAQDCQASWVGVLMAMYSDAVPCRDNNLHPRRNVVARSGSLALLRPALEPSHFALTQGSLCVPGYLSEKTETSICPGKAYSDII